MLPRVHNAAYLACTSSIERMFFPPPVCSEGVRRAYGLYNRIVCERPEPAPCFRQRPALSCKIYARRLFPVRYFCVLLAANH